MLVLKVFEKKNETPIIYRVTNFPCTIGRSLDSSVMINCESVSALHATISKLDGETLLVEDNDSTNGIYIDEEPHQSFLLEKNSTIHIGEVRIDLILDPYVPEKTKFITRPMPAKASAVKPTFLMLAANLALLIAFLIIDKFLYSPLNKKSLLDLLLSLFIIFGALLGLSIPFAIKSKIFSNQLNLFKNTMYVFSFFNILFLYDLLSPYLFDILTNSSNSMKIEFYLGVILLIAGLYYIVKQDLDNLSAKIVRIGFVTIGVILGSIFYLYSVVNSRDDFGNYRSRIVYPIFKTKTEKIDALESHIKNSIQTLNEVRSETIEEIEDN